MSLVNVVNDGRFVPGNYVPSRFARPTQVLDQVVPECGAATGVCNPELSTLVPNSVCPDLVPNSVCPDHDKESDRHNLAALLQTKAEEFRALKESISQSASEFRRTVNEIERTDGMAFRPGNAAITQGQDCRPTVTFRDFYVGEYRLRRQRDPSHLADRLRMLRKAYSLIYGLTSGKRSPMNEDLHGVSLLVEEQGDFLRAEFDRLEDAFNAGVDEFRKFRETPTVCAVQRSTYLALLYVLARAMGCSTDFAWSENLKVAHRFLRESAMFDGPTNLLGSNELRTAISPQSLSQRGLIAPALQRFVACALIIRRWQFECRKIQELDFHFDVGDRYPQIPYWNGQEWTERLPADLQRIAGFFARKLGRGMDR
jgi:hypothetical protein